MSELLELAIAQKQIPRYLYKYTTIENAIKAIEGGIVSFSGFDHCHKGTSLLSYEPKINVKGKRINDEINQLERHFNNVDSEIVVLDRKRSILSEKETRFLESLGFEFYNQESA